MPGDKLRHFQTGEPWSDVLRTEVVNAFVDGARLAHGQGPRIGLGGGRQPLAFGPQSGVVIIKNSSGSDAQRGYILGIDDVGIDPTDDSEDGFWTDLVFECSTPDIDVHEHEAVILLDHIPNGQYGRGIAAGYARCQINVTDADHLYAVLTDDDATKLTSDADEGFPILWKESGTGTLWAVVRLGFRVSTVLEWTQITDTATISTGASSYDLEYAADNSLVGETRYLFRFASPPIDCASIIGVRIAGIDLSGKVLWDTGDGPYDDVYYAPTWQAYPITEDFNTGTVTWASQPAIGSYLLSGSAKFRATELVDDGDGNYLELNTWQLYAASKVESGGQDIAPNGLAASGTDWYGFEIRAFLPAAEHNGWDYDRWVDIDSPVAYLMT